MARTDVSKFYNEIIENVISNVKEEFENEGVDEQILEDLKQIWKTKLLQSRALESQPRYQAAAPNAALNQASRNYLKHDMGAGKQRAVDMTRTQQTLSGPAEMASIAIQNVPHVNLPTELAQQSLALPQAAPGAQQPVYRCYQVGDQLVYAVQPPTMQQVQAAVLQQQQQQQLQQQQQQQQQRQLSGAASQATSAAAMSQTLQQIQVQSQQAQQSSVLQVDGGNDSSSDDDDFGDDDEEDDDGKDDDDGDEDGDDHPGAEVEEAPLNSDDDDSGDEPEDIFDTDNVIVCQYEKINRTRNRWKFHLKDGIMNLEGKDWVFHRGIGEADW